MRPAQTSNIIARSASNSRKKSRVTVAAYSADFVRIMFSYYSFKIEILGKFPDNFYPKRSWQLSLPSGS
jgi:hypothetical protein